MKRRMKNLGKSITLTNNKSPKKHSLPLLQKKNKSKKKIHYLLLGNNNQKLLDLVSPRNKRSYFLNKEKLRLNEFFPDKKNKMKNKNKDKKTNKTNESKMTKKTKLKMRMIIRTTKKRKKMTEIP